MNEEPYGGNDASTLVEACVGKVCETYLVAYAKKNTGDLTTTDSVMLSLSDWQGDFEPQNSQVVMLVNPTLYMRGWRARAAYPVTSQTNWRSQS
jgi:hypothetical protein